MLKLTAKDQPHPTEPMPYLQRSQLAERGENVGRQSLQVVLPQVAFSCHSSGETTRQGGAKVRREPSAPLYLGRDDACARLLLLRDQAVYNGIGRISYLDPI